MINLVWGESIVVRDAFLNNVKNHILMTSNDLRNLNYPPHEGDRTLVATTRNVIKRQVGREYKHIFLVNGAAGGVTIALRAFARLGYRTCVTEQPPYFSLYPDMIMASGLKHEIDNDRDLVIKPVFLVDSPSNPENVIRLRTHDIYETPIVWDAVYHSGVYAKIRLIPDHDVTIGSYSKLTGLNGIRVGWIGTNNDILADMIARLVTGEYCGISGASQTILNMALDEFDWERFEVEARSRLDVNRGEWQKLTKYFEGKDVSSNGMFYYGPMNSASKRLFEKAEVLWTPGSKLGHSDDFGRFNLGASHLSIQEAVATVLKADYICP